MKHRSNCKGIKSFLFWQHLNGNIKPLFLFIFFINICLLTGCFFGKNSHKNELGNDRWEKLVQTQEGGEQGEESEDFRKFTDALFLENLTSDGLTFHYTLHDPGRYFKKMEGGNMDSADTHGLADGNSFEGITVPDTLGEYGIDQMRRNLAENENYRKQLESFDYDSLSVNQQLLYDIMEQYFSEEDVREELLWYNEPLRPQSGIATQLPVLLAEYRFCCREDVDHYLKLLEQIEPYFSDLIKYEQEKSQKGLFMSEDSLKQVLENCEAFIEQPEENYLLDVFEERIDELGNQISRKEKEELCRQNREKVLENVIPAYQLLIDGLRRLSETNRYKGGLCRYPDGKEYYEKAAAAYTGSDKSVEEMKELLDDTLKEKKLEMQAAFQTGGTAQEYDSYEYPETEPEKILSYLEENIKEDFPEFSKTSYEIKKVSEKMEESLSPAFYLTPALDDYEENVIYFNQSKVGRGNELFPTLAHEGYPGHMLQNVWFCRREEEPLRYVLQFPGYEEGWGTYAEAWSYKVTGISNALSTILIDDLISSLAIYARVDIGVNYEGWSVEQTASYLEELNLTDASQAEALFRISVSEPFLYLKYIIGYLEIMELKETAEKQWGDAYSEKRFHQFFLDMGPAPFSVLEKWLGGI